MYRVDPEEYRRDNKLGDNDPVPSVDIFPYTEELHKELSSEDDVCFAQAAAFFFLGEIPLEEYFDELLAHLKPNAKRHPFDTASAKLLDLFRVDIISGAIKSQMLNPLVPRVEEKDFPKLKDLCILTYHTTDVAVLLRKASAADAPLESIPSHWLDILVAIAYARRHVEIFEHLVTYQGPPTKTIFDLMNHVFIRHRLAYVEELEHCTNRDIDYRLTEIKLWTAMLQTKEESGWIHYPMLKGPRGLEVGLHCLIDLTANPEMRASPEVATLCKLLGEHGVIPWPGSMSQFLSIINYKLGPFPLGISPCGIPEATMLLSCFPLSRLRLRKGFRGLQPGESATLTLPVANWERDNPDRLAIMRMLLEQGCDPNDKLSFEVYPPTHHQRNDTALHQAAERGDEPMVDLLLEFGARGDVMGGISPDETLGMDFAREHFDYHPEMNTPVQRAMAHGHPRIAARIEGYVQGQGLSTAEVVLS